MGSELTSRVRVVRVERTREDVDWLAGRLTEVFDGARSVLVPTPVTRSEEVSAAPVVARDLDGAVDLVLEWARG